MGEETREQAIQGAITHADAPAAAIGQSPVLRTPGIIVNLAAYIAGVFERNAEYRRQTGIDESLLKNLRAMRGLYDPEDLDKINASGAPVVYIPLSNMKRRAAISWITEIFASAADRAFSVDATDEPEMSPEVTQAVVAKTMADWVAHGAATGNVMPPEAVKEYAAGQRDHIAKQLRDEAKARAARMEMAITAQQEDGNWYGAMEEFIDLLSTYGTAVLMGPIVRMKRKLKWKKTPMGWRPVMTDILMLEWDAISPWDCFPAKGSTSIHNGPFCRRVRFTPSGLRSVSRLPSWNEGAIKEALKIAGGSGIRVAVASDAERTLLEQQGSLSLEQSTIEGIEIWDDIPGRLLIGQGITRTPEDEIVQADEYYAVNAISINGKVVYCHMSDPGMDRPLSKCCFFSVVGSWWGNSPMEAMRDVQKAANAAVRSLVVNMAQASGPQGYMDDASRLSPSDDGKLRPWKIWMFLNPQNSPSSPLRFFNIPSNAGELLEVYDRFARVADEVTGIPAYSYGSDAVAGAGRTMGGLSMLMGAAARGIKQVVSMLDRNVIFESVTRMHVWNMLFNPDESIKGDVKIKARGVSALLIKEQVAQKRMELLAATANPVDAPIMGATGRANLIRKAASTVGMDGEDLVPSNEELQQREQAAAQQQAMLAAAEAQAQQAKGGAGASPQGAPPAPMQPQPAGGPQ